MKTRMQPIGNVWSSSPASCATWRWPAASGCARDGGQRNRAGQDDHRGDQGPAHPPGAQLPSTTASSRPRSRRRRQAAEGRLLLRAFHEGGQVNIEISDDGAGIDLERITSKALERA